MTIDEEKDSKLLFSFMKNKETWDTEFNENTKRVRYYNPLAASYLGLKFHCDESWLDAVRDRVSEYIIKGDQDLMVVYNNKNPEDLCFQVFIGKEMIIHYHTSNFLKGYRKILVGIVEYLTYKDN